jgi:CheY-like chemotaxis protein
MTEAEQKPSFHILLAEDNDVNRELATRLLQRRGHIVVGVTNGQEAVDQFRNGSFDLILMDMEMPVMDGVEASKAIRALEQESNPPKHIPIIAMTAWDSHEIADSLKGGGMDGFIPKPIKTKELDDDLRAIVAKVRGGSGAS